MQVKPYKMVAFMLVAFGCWTLCAKTVDAVAFGAKPDGVTDNTAAIQKAIDACHDAGGGTVVVPAGGTYVTYTLSLKSNVSLEIERGAVLMGGNDPFGYPLFEPTPPGMLPMPTKPAFCEMLIAPTPISALSFVEANIGTPYGRVASRWEREGRVIRYHVTLPPGTTAVFRAPGLSERKLVPGMHEFSVAKPESENARCLRHVVLENGGKH